MAMVLRGSTKWLFTREQIENTPSRRNGIEPDRELSYRQQAANLIQDMGQRLNVSQLTINTAIVYMHRFYMLNSFTKFHRNVASKDLAQTSYFMATNSLHLTTFCLQYRPTVVACVCIHLACKWSNWEIPISSDGKHWWEYLDPTVTLQLLDQLTHEFLQILEKTPSRLKRIRNWRATQAAKRSKTECQSVGNTFQSPLSGQDSLLFDSKPDLMAGIYQDSSILFPSDSLNGLANPGSSFVQTDAPSSLQAVPISSKSQHTASNKMSLEKYREKQAAEILQRRKHGHMLPETAALAPSSSLSAVLMSSAAAPSSSSSSSTRVKYSQSGQEREMKSGSLKRRHPSSSSSSMENGAASQEELKMKIKMSESGGKSRHSPRSGREKHRASKHDNTHLHTHSHAHGSHHKAHRSSKSHASATPLPPVSHAQLGKIERRVGEGPSTEGAAPLLLNGQHVDYADTFNMLDSLLNAHNMNY
ncbi:Cyclin-T2 [Bagarius yarrelli]|uniref:Cyclin-T2 n=1 Tax=Bagarius yarrelli TaxID=175774 RepID=A0A556TTX6_BAGYA|nr:Cyclin-T2 [Bagarius yarrelli]